MHGFELALHHCLHVTSGVVTRGYKGEKEE